MHTIHKFRLNLDSSVNEINLPDSYEPICVAEQDFCPTVWIILDPRQPTKPKPFYIYGTGHEIEQRNLKKYIGTVHQKNGLVWHIFH